jgi:hypothetical protein
MAVTLPSDFFLPQLALQYMRQGFYESLQPMQRLVSQTDPSAPICLVNDPTMEVSQYVQGPTFQRMGTSAVSLRDITSNSAATPIKISAVNDIGVKCHRKAGPFEWTLDAARLAGLGNDDMSRAAAITQEISTQVGEYLGLNVQRSIIAALRGMVEAMTSTLHTSTVWSSTSRTNIAPGILNSGLNLMGDARDYITHWIFRSETLQDLYSDAIGRSFSNVGDRALMGNQDTNTLGRVRAITDDPNLIATPGGFNKYFTLGLGAQQLYLYFTQPLTMYQPYVATDRETVTVRLRWDFDFELRGRGLAWNSGAGGANPTDSALVTAANWTPTYSTHKEVRIVELVHNYSGA